MRKLLPVVITSLYLLACTKNDKNPNALNEQDRNFLQQVYASNKNEIETGQVALSTSNNTAVRNFAQDAIAHYSLAQTDLRELLSRINFYFDTTLSPVQSSLFSDLSGYTFDTTYMKSRVLTHRNLLGVFQNELNEGNHTYVRYYYLNKYIDIVRLNYSKADSIARSL